MKFSFTFNDTGQIATGYSLKNEDDAKLTPLKKVSTEDFLNTVFAPMTTPVGLLPPAVRWLSQDRKMVVFERPPAMYLVELALATKHEAGDAAKHSFQIPVPWTVYIAYFDYEYNPVKINAYVRNEALTSLDDLIYLLPLPNFYMDGSLCNPVVGTFTAHPATLSWGIQEAFNMVWNSGFNLDLFEAMRLSFLARLPWPAAFRNVMIDSHAVLTTWATKSIPDILRCKFQTPSAYRNDWLPPGGGMPLSTVMELFSETVQNEGAGGAQELIVQLVNAFSS